MTGTTELQQPNQSLATRTNLDLNHLHSQGAKLQHHKTFQASHNVEN